MEDDKYKFVPFTIIYYFKKKYRYFFHADGNDLCYS